MTLTPSEGKNMKKVRWLVVFFALFAGRAGAQSIDVDAMASPAADAGSAEAVVQAAPGGGDMVVLGPESRYVTRAWRDHDGHMQCGCTREDAATAERVRSGVR
jgi:hypothetical protein